MALELTDVTKQAAGQLNVEPNIVFEIDGYAHKFGTAQIKKLIRIGDPGLEIGNDWTIGGYRLIDNQSQYISFNTGTTTRITQQISPDRAQGSSTSQMVISLIDKNEEISQLVSPGFILQDVLGRDAKVKIGFTNTDIDRDYNVIFQGVISDYESGPGYVNFILTNTEEKKRKALTTSSTTKLNGAIGAGAITTLTLDDTASFYNHVLGPDGLYDDDIEFYARIDDEFFRYTGKSGNTLTGVTRAQFATTAVAHDDDSEVTSFIRLRGNGLELAQKLMLSGWGGFTFTGVEIEHINFVDVSTPQANTIFFDVINVQELYGVAIGDYVTITGSAHAPNNVSLKQISDIGVTEDGSYIIIDGVTFTDELDSPATISFRSQYDTLPIGLKMKLNEVDVKEHNKIKERFLSIFNFDFLESDISNAKDFIEKEIYLPMACFSVPRKGRSSLAFHVGPIADTTLVTLDDTNVLNADKLKVRRSLSKNFANAVTFEFETDRLNQDFTVKKEYNDADAIQRLATKKELRIQAKGMREAEGAQARSQQSANRMLRRYKLGAEYILGLQVKFGDGYATEIGDIVVVDFDALQVTDFGTGSRSGSLKLMEVMNKVLDQKTGEVTIDLVNTIFSNNDRFGLISPASKIVAGSSTTKINLEKSWSTKSFQKESAKWTKYIGQTVLVHSPDWTYAHTTVLQSFSDDGLSMFVAPALPSAPLASYIVQAPNYPNTSDPNDEFFWKAGNASFSPQLKVTTGVSQTVFNVSVGDAAKILVGAILDVHNFDYSQRSPEVVVTDKTGTQITVDQALGFTPNSNHYIDLVGFLDGGYAYRYL